MVHSLHGSHSDLRVLQEVTEVIEQVSAALEAVKTELKHSRPHVALLLTVAEHMPRSLLAPPQQAQHAQQAQQAQHGQQAQHEQHVHKAQQAQEEAQQAQHAQLVQQAQHAQETQTVQSGIQLSQHHGPHTEHEQARPELNPNECSQRQQTQAQQTQTTACQTQHDQTQSDMANSANTQLHPCERSDTQESHSVLQQQEHPEGGTDSIAQLLTGPELARYEALQHQASSSEQHVQAEQDSPVKHPQHQSPDSNEQEGLVEQRPGGNDPQSHLPDCIEQQGQIEQQGTVADQVTAVQQQVILAELLSDNYQDIMAETLKV